MATNNSVDVTLAGQTGTGTFVGSTSPTITTPIIAAIKGTNGFNVATFADVASTTDYLSITSGIANGAEIRVTSSNTNAAWSLISKGSGGIAINPGGTATVPMALYFGANNVEFNVGALTGSRTLTFPDADRNLTQIPASTATANQILLSGSTAQPTWSTTTYPATNAINTIMYASSANVLGVIAAANNSVLVSSAGGVPSWSTTLPAFTTSSITFNPTTSGIVGTTTNNNASAGYVGEFISAQANVGTVSLTNNVVSNVTSISLTAGDWDVYGVVSFSAGAGTLATAIVAGISSTSATYDAQVSEGAIQQLTLPFASSGNQLISAGRRRYSLSGTTTIYLLAVAAFSVSTYTAGGFIGARRMR